MLASFSYSLRSSLLRLGGTMILISAYRCPGNPRGLGMPCPRSRSLRPLEEPSGTVIVTVPVGAWVLILAPTAASEGVTGRSKIDVPALESVSGVRLDACGQEQIPRRTPVAALGALPRKANALTVQHTGGHVDVIVPGFATRLGQADGAPSATDGFFKGQLKLGFVVRPLGRACSLLSEPATEQILPIDLASHIDVSVAVPAAPRARARPGAGPRAAGTPPHATAPRAGAAAGVLPVVGAETVIARPGFGIRQGVVGLTDLLELFGGIRLAVYVRMVFPCQFAVGALNFVGLRCARDSENRVVVLSHGPGSPPGSPQRRLAGECCPGHRSQDAARSPGSRGERRQFPPH